MRELSVSVGQAERNYHKAVADNLQSIGLAVRVQGDDPDTTGICVSVEHDGGLYTWTVDMIRWNNDTGSVEVHVSNMGGNDTDYWNYVSNLGDAEDYVLDAIQWEDHADRQESENDDLYAYVGWPEFQMLQEKEGFDENAYFCAEENAWFIRQGWLRENNK